jgi:hypothetical protein
VVKETIPCQRGNIQHSRASLMDVTEEAITERDLQIKIDSAVNKTTSFVMYMWHS